MKMTQSRHPLMFDYIILTVGTNCQLPPLGWRSGRGNFLSWHWNSRCAPAQRAALWLACFPLCPFCGCRLRGAHASFAFAWRHATFVCCCLSTVACRCHVVVDAVVSVAAAAAEVVVVISCCSCQLSTAVCRWSLLCSSRIYIFRATF